jgi:hypothetical protein
MMTSLDNVMFAMIVVGVGLCVAYFRGEYIAWRKLRAAEIHNGTMMRKLHLDRLLRQEADPNRGGVNLEGTANTAELTATIGGSQLAAHRRPGAAESTSDIDEMEYS